MIGAAIQVKPTTILVPAEPRNIVFLRLATECRGNVKRNLFNTRTDSGIREELKEEEKQMLASFMSRYQICSASDIDDKTDPVENLVQKELREHAIKMNANNRGERAKPYARKPQSSITEFYNERKKVCNNSRTSDVHSLKEEADKLLQNPTKGNVELENTSTTITNTDTDTDSTTSASAATNNESSPSS